MIPADDTAGKLSRGAIEEAVAVVQALSAIEPDLVDLSERLETFPVFSFPPDRCMSAWRGLYLSIYEVPRCLILVGSIDDTPELAGLAEDMAGLLIVETDAKTVSTAELLPRGAQWRSMTEFAPHLEPGDRVTLATALVNGLQPARVLVMGSRAGWEMLACYGGALRSNTALFAATTSSPELSATNLLGSYLQRCIPVLSALYGPDGRTLHRIADLFGLAPEERDKLREFKDWRDASGVLAASRDGK